MIKLKRYLKPFLLGLIATFALLFVQAMCDLNLPNYMSDIVNVGIQQGGVERGVPEVISENGFKLMVGFMTEQQKDEFEKNYTLLSGEQKDSSGKAYNETYHNLGEGNFYKLNDIESEKVDDMEKSFELSTFTMFNFLEDMAQNQPQADADTKTEQSVAEFTPEQMQELYEIIPMVQTVPQEQIDEIREDIADMDTMMLEKGGTMMVSAFYTELGVDMQSYQSSYIIKVGLKMLGISLISGIATIIVSLISAQIAAGVARNLRNDVFKKTLKFSSAEYDKFSSASLITRSTNDITQIQQFLTIGIRMICYAPIMGIGGVIIAMQKSISMSWIIAVAVIALLGVVGVIFSIAIPKFKAMQKLVDKLNLVARETLNGLMVIRAFGTQKFEKDRFESANTNLAKTMLFTNKTMAFIMPAMMLIMNTICLVIVWVGAYQIEQSAMQVGDMMAFMQYSMQIIFAFLMIAMMFMFIPRASVSAVRIAEVLDTKESVNDTKSPKKISGNIKGLVEFKNVCFRYDGADEEALINISFTAKPGETTAFVGATGSGKSTLINLIPRFYDATDGEILVDGVNVKDITQKELREHIGFVPQKSILMSGTIESNIKYANDSLSDAEIREIAQVAQALDFIEEKKEKFDTEISQGGSNVSGGQRQRLSIARALAVKPDIYIFDDSFSALDYKTDATLRKALHEYTNESTVIIVAQRVSTIMNADCIHVIEDGKIIASGTHKELLKTSPEYLEIASTQLSKEELFNE